MEKLGLLNFLYLNFYVYINIAIATIYIWVGIESFILNKKKFSKILIGQLGICLFNLLYILTNIAPSISFLNKYGKELQLWATSFGFFSLFFYLLAITSYLNIKSKLFEVSKIASIIWGIFPIIDFFHFKYSNQYMLFIHNPIPKTIQLKMYNIQLAFGPLGYFYFSIIFVLILSCLLKIIHIINKHNKNEKLLLTGLIASILTGTNDMLMGFDTFIYLVPLFYLGNIFEVVRFRDYFKVKAFKQVQSLKYAMTGMAKLAQVGQNAGSIAHDINNPLMIIDLSLLKINKVLKKENISNQDVTNALERIEKSSSIMKNIVQTYTKLIRNEVKDEAHFSELIPIVENSIELSKSRLLKYNVDISYDKESHYFIKCRPSEMIITLTNLITNAADAISGLENKWIKIEFIKNKDHPLFINIIDSGNGIPPKILKKIFNLQFTTKTVGKGTGLGLGIVKQLLEDHEFIIYVDINCPNTKFVIQVPNKYVKEIEN